MEASSKCCKLEFVVSATITNADELKKLILAKSIDTIINFASQTHVYKSFGDSLYFTHNNVFGTHVLLEACRKVAGQIKKFIHISTDEVYGETKRDVASIEISRFEPTNPFVATKAATMHMALTSIRK